MPEPGYKASFTGGFFGEYRINKAAFELNTMYIDAGHNGNIDLRATGDPNEPLTNHNFKVSLKKVNIEGYLKYYIVEKISIKTGAFYGFVIDSKNTLENYNDNFAWVGREWKKHDAGLAIGAEVSITKSLFLECKYMWGLTDLQEWKTNEFYPEFDPIVDGGLGNGFEAKSRFISISLCYLF